MKLAPHDPLPVTDYRNTTQKKLELQADAVIVGSGAGGGVMAYELAKAGKKVIVLEAGGYHPSSEFTETTNAMFEMLFQDKGSQTTADGNFLVLQGRCVGGSTVVNGAVCFRTPDFILKDWQTIHGLTDMTTEKLAPFFDLVEQRLSIHVNTPAELNLNSQILQRGCDKLGIANAPMSRNIKDCALTGFCLQGCASDRKQSMLVTYLPWAAELGAQIIANTTAEKVLVENGVAIGIEGEMTDPVSGGKIADVRVTAPIVVIAAGAIQTPVLLIKNKLANSSGQVGRNFALHPSSAVMARFKDEIYSYRGALLGAYCSEYQLPEDGGFIIEGGSTGSDSLALLSPGFGKQHLEFMDHINNIATVATLVHDEGSGWIEWSPENGKKIVYELSENDKPRVRKAMKVAAQIYFAAGAEEVILPTYVPTTIKSVNDIDKVIDAIEIGLQTFFYYSYHPQGTCRMGVDKTKSVVGPTGETHDVKNLYIADASIFPTSVLVNPSETVYALSTLIAEGINKRA